MSIDDDELDGRLTRPAGGDDGDDSEPVDDGVLLAYLAGSLDDAETEAVEEVLIENAAARAQLRALSNARTVLGPADFEAAEEAAAPRKRRTWLPWATVGLAAAAALALWFARPQTVESGWTVDGPHGSVQRVRGVSKMTGVYLPNSEFYVDLAPPEGDPPHEVAVYVSYIKEVRARPATVTRSPGGAIRVSARADTLFTDRFGNRTVYVIIDPPDIELDGMDDLAMFDRVDPSKRFAFPVIYQKTEKP